VPEQEDVATPTDAPLTAGTKVEVRTGFDRSWAQGFEVEGSAVGGYLVRRRSDGDVLPAPIPRADVRKERKNSMWWV
jgi:hypothetical protein